MASGAFLDGVLRAWSPTGIIGPESSSGGSSIAHPQKGVGKVKTFKTERRFLWKNEIFSRCFGDVLVGTSFTSPTAANFQPKWLEFWQQCTFAINCPRLRVNPTQPLDNLWQPNPWQVWPRGSTSGRRVKKGSWRQNVFTDTKRTGERNNMEGPVAVELHLRYKTQTWHHQHSNPHPPDHHSSRFRWSTSSGTSRSATTRPRPPTSSVSPFQGTPYSTKKTFWRE